MPSSSGLSQPDLRLALDRLGKALTLLNDERIDGIAAKIAAVCELDEHTVTTALAGRAFHEWRSVEIIVDEYFRVDWRYFHPLWSAAESACTGGIQAVTPLAPLGSNRLKIKRVTNRNAKTTAPDGTTTEINEQIFELDLGDD